MGLDDDIQRIRAARLETEEAQDRAATLRETQRVANVEKAEFALQELGRSAAAALEGGDVPMFAEMAIVRLPPPISFFDGGYTLKIKSGRMWILDSFHLALDRDGIFYRARAWSLGSGTLGTKTSDGRTLYSDYLRSSFNKRAEDITRRRGLPGGYMTRQKIEPVGSPPPYSVDFGSEYGYFMVGDKLMAGDESNHQPFQLVLAGYLETLLR